MEHLLLHPPFADPTQPYLSLPTLKGFLRGRGLDARVIDLNLEATHWLFSKDSLELVARRLGSHFVDLNRKQELSFAEQREYRELVEARPKIERILGADPSPITVFQERERFFDPAQYTLARRQVEGYFEALSAAFHPYRFGFNQAAHSVVPWSFDMLSEYASGEMSPLHAFYEAFFAGPDEWDWSRGDAPPTNLAETAFIGVSVVFPSQIPEALHLLRFLREHAPTAYLALGGPGIHQVAVHLEPELQKRLFEYVDGIGLYEGERTLEALLPRLERWRASAEVPAHHDDKWIEARDARLAARLARFELLRDVPNLLQIDPSSGEPVLGPRHTLDLRTEHEIQDYSDLDLDRYLAPSRTLLYAPTRGCYWGKCSFCYYGLADTATASYREVPPERAALDLQQLARRHGVKNFYLSCDVLSPVYAVKLAQALVDKGVKIRWSSDLKIEKYFTPERCALLFESGLRAAAFGIESGSDRILELMRKGSDRATMTSVNRSFQAAGIATEWMTFTDHPDESREEALATVDWIGEEREHISTFIVGRFGLERGSHIAQEPERYGVRRIYWAEGDELRLYAMFSHRGGRRSRDVEEAIEREIDQVASAWALNAYPWAGANSTHHTFLHLVEFGPRAFRTHFQRAPAAMHGALGTAPQAHIPGLRERARFSLQLIEDTEVRFFDGYLPHALYTTIPARRQGRGSGAGDEVAPLSREDFDAAAAAIEPLRATQR